MKTLVKGGWVVSFRQGRHCMDRDFEVVYEGDEILYIGPRFDGQADRVIDASSQLVCPGFIDTHVHTGHRASHRLITDTGRGEFFGEHGFDLERER